MMSFDQSLQPMNTRYKNINIFFHIRYIKLETLTGGGYHPPVGRSKHTSSYGFTFISELVTNDIIYVAIKSAISKLCLESVREHRNVAAATRNHKQI